jgi:hypothetical protein
VTRSPAFREYLVRRVFVIRVILTSAEWAIVEPMVPPAKQGGRKRTIDVRESLEYLAEVAPFTPPWLLR